MRIGDSDLVAVGVYHAEGEIVIEPELYSEPGLFRGIGSSENRRL